MADRRLFGTDGVRGLANRVLTPELAFNLARAAASVLGNHSQERPRVLIGKDTRQSSDMLEAALTAGFCSAGFDVELLSIVPTPAVAWLVKQRHACLGAMISASHNAAPDNGIKLFNQHGEKLADKIESEIEACYFAGEFARPEGAGVGQVFALDEVVLEPYIEHLLRSDLADFDGLKIAVDLAHGAMVKVAPRVFNRLDLEVHYLHREPTGMNINENCGSTDLGPLTRFVREQGCDLGIAFDGDGDRCLAVGPQGQEIDGDLILYLCSRYVPVLTQEQQVVATVMSNLGLEHALQSQDKKLLRTQVGDRYVLEAMKELDISLGGEQSGHVIFSHYQVTGDGLLTALQFLNAIRCSGKSLTTLLDEMKRYPQVLKNVRVSTHWHQHWHEHEGLKSAMQQVEADLSEEGRLLVRASGTEPKLRVMAEGQNSERIDSAVMTLVELIQAEMAA